MGCDIHGVVERKVGEKWITVLILDSAALDRNYSRFAQLAGVRGPGPAPRGLPADISETGRFLAESWGEDGHSHSWLPTAEAAEIFQRTEYVSEGNVLPVMIKDYPEAFFFQVTPRQSDLHRFVFWFDN